MKLDETTLDEKIWPDSVPTVDLKLGLPELQKF